MWPGGPWQRLPRCRKATGGILYTLFPNWCHRPPAAIHELPYRPSATPLPSSPQFPPKEKQKERQKK